MDRRNFIGASAATSAMFLLFPLKAMASQENCLRALEGVDVESNDSPFFTHYHQLIISVSDFVNPPAAGITLATSAVDQGSFDAEALEAYAKAENISVSALQNHDHVVRISKEELNRISSGEKNVEVKVYSRDGKNYVHNFLITAPNSLLAIVKKERRK